MTNRSFAKILILITVASLASAPALFAQEDDLGDLSQYAGAEALRDLLVNSSESFILVDTRSWGEYVSGHIPGAIHIEYTDIGDEPPTDDTTMPIILYCRSGNRAGRALRTLERLGYERVFNWGGIIDWPYEIVEGAEPGALPAAR